MRKKVTAVTKLHAMKCFIVSLNFFFSKLCLVLLLYGFHIHIKLLFIWHTRLWLGLF